MITYIEIKEKKIEFQTSVLAIRDFAFKRKITFEEAIKRFSNKMDFEDYISMFHSSIHTIKGQENITEDDVWQWINDDMNLMTAMMNALIESMPKNVFSPTQSGQK